MTDLIRSLRVGVIRDAGRTGLLATAQFQLGPLVVTGVKVIADSRSGAVKVIYPDYAGRSECPACPGLVPLTNSYCGDCGAEQPPAAARRDRHGNRPRFKSVVFPPTREDRKALDDMILAAYLAAAGVRPKLNVVSEAC